MWNGKKVIVACDVIFNEDELISWPSADRPVDEENRTNYTVEVKEHAVS